MWWTAYDGTNRHIYYSTSTDGVTWSGHTLAIDHGVVADASTRAAYPSAIKDGSTYEIWWSAYDGTNYHIYHSDVVDNYAASSTYESPVIDLGAEYSGDLVVFHTDIPSGTTLTSQARSGNPVTLTSGGISGVTGKYTNPEHPNGVSGTLSFTVTGTTLRWRDDSQAIPTFGTAVDVSAGGTFKIYDGSVTTNFIEVEVVAASLPAADATATYTTSTWTSFTASTSLITGTYKVNFFSIDQSTATTNRFWQYRLNGTTDGSTTWIVRDVILIPQPTNWGRLEEDILNCNPERYWQYVLLGTSDGSATWSFDDITLTYRRGYIDLGAICKLSEIKAYSVGISQDISEIAISSENISTYTALNYANFSHYTPTEGTETPRDYTVDFGTSPQSARWVIISHYEELREIRIYWRIAKTDNKAYLADAGGTELPSTGVGDQLYYTTTLPDCILGGDPSSALTLRIYAPTVDIGTSGSWTLQANTSDGVDHVELSADGTTWTPVSGSKQGITLGGITAGSFREVYIRTTAPTGTISTKKVRIQFFITIGE